MRLAAFASEALSLAANEEAPSPAAPTAAAMLGAPTEAPLPAAPVSPSLRAALPVARKLALTASPPAAKVQPSSESPDYDGNRSEAST